jgi:hypothetical protein
MDVVEKRAETVVLVVVQAAPPAAQIGPTGATWQFNESFSRQEFSGRACGVIS